jgi:hypothetical protein
MATSNQEQQSVLVPQHKRLAQGAPINGQSMGGSGKAPAKSGGLAGLSKKNK